MQYLLNEREYDIYTRLKEDKEIHLKALESVLLTMDKNDPVKATYLEDKETCEYVLGIRDDRPLHEKRREKRNNKSK